MPLPYVQIGNKKKAYKIAPFLSADARPYGLFSNAYLGAPLIQDIPEVGNGKTISWPTAEHAFHGQKLLNFIRTLDAPDSRKEILFKSMEDLASTRLKASVGTPAEYYRQIVLKLIGNKRYNFGSTEAQFNEFCGADYDPITAPNKGLDDRKQPMIVNFMREVIYLRRQHDKAFFNQALLAAQEGIIPVAVGDDPFWTSGRDGKGRNLLGILIHQEAIKIRPDSDISRKLIEMDYEPIRSNFHEQLQSDFLEPKCYNLNYKGTTIEAIQALLAHQKIPVRISVVTDGLNSREVALKLQFTNEEDARKHRPKEHSYGLRRLNNSKTYILEGLNAEGYIQSLYPATQATTVLNDLKKEFLEQAESLKPYYQYANLHSSRFHLFKAKPSNPSADPKNKADILKTRILLQFKKELLSCQTRDELNNKLDELKKSADYQILAKGQGMISRMFGLKTSSLLALDKMVADLSRMLHRQAPPKK